MYLNNLGNELGTRFYRIGAMNDINRAVEVADIVVKATPHDHSNRAIYLNSLGSWLSTRFERTGSIDDLDYAVKVADMTVDVTPQDHPNRAIYLRSLGDLLGIRSRRTGSVDDLNRAVEVADMAVDVTPQDHPNRAVYLNSLGNNLGTRFERTGSIEDFYRRLSCFEKGWACRASPPSIRITSARHAAIIFSSQLMFEDASSLLEGAVKLLPIVSPQALANNDKQYILGQFSGLASMAAALALEVGKDAYQALELLELGRCIITGLLLEIRIDISDLQQQHPTLAEEFISFRNKLDSPPSIAIPLDNTASSWKL